MATRAGDTKEAVRILELAWTSLDRPPEAIGPLLRRTARVKSSSSRVAEVAHDASCSVRVGKERGSVRFMAT